MKIAPLLVLGTLSALLVALTASRQVEKRPESTALDVSGIDALAVSGGESGVEIRLDPKAPASVTFDTSGSPNLAVVRRGSTLAIRYKSARYATVRIVVPTSIRRFDLGSDAEITSLAPVADVQVEASQDATWKGDVENLRVTGTGGWRGACAQSIIIREGQVGRLQISSPSANVSLVAADMIGVADVDAGRGGKLSVSGASHLDHIHLKPGQPVRPTAEGSCAASALNQAPGACGCPRR